ncbi:hypothetical protein BaRGS_00039485 [Batillaria attramentaria]|uniref:Uncharacterized protein n=1 Tax=Batillaria attramentaria TaxID=370345 RepID=A0ABD0J3B0_9CAEN
MFCPSDQILFPFPYEAVDFGALSCPLKTLKILHNTSLFFLEELFSSYQNPSVFFANSYVNNYVHSCVNSHVNSYLNGHVNSRVNSYVNSHISSYVTSHFNGYVNDYVSSYVNAHVNRYVNSHVNSYVNMHVNSYVNNYLRTERLKVSGDGRLVVTINVNRGNTFSTCYGLRSARSFLFRYMPLLTFQCLKGFADR